MNVDDEVHGRAHFDIDVILEEDKVHIVGHDVAIAVGVVVRWKTTRI